MKPIKLQANTVNRLAASIHKRNHKWWHDAKGKPVNRNDGELLMLVVTELAEAVEGIRKDLMDDHLPHLKMEEVEMADAVIRLLDFAAGNRIKISLNRVVDYDGECSLFFYQNKCEKILAIVEKITMAWRTFKVARGFSGYRIGVAVACIIHYCEFRKLNLNRAIAEKLEYNRTRADHTHEARAKANGKKF